MLATGRPLIVLGITQAPPGPMYPVIVMLVPSEAYLKSPYLSETAPTGRERMMKTTRQRMTVPVPPVSVASLLSATAAHGSLRRVAFRFL